MMVNDVASLDTSSSTKASLCLYVCDIGKEVSMV